ncbi:hypothetical protein ACH9EU_16705 [Kocuria sp. M1R5S2]|uniref:hypothetical protein n=1 Tax=Kocuria rhizosphaerae TaxID=3376285 RepID=UPI00379B063E
MTPTGSGRPAADDESWARGSRLGRPGAQGPGRFGPGYDLPGHRGGPRTGPRLFPFPGWTTRTRRGTNVTVGGCCLPLPIGCLTTAVLAGAVAVVVAGRS